MQELHTFGCPSSAARLYKIASAQVLHEVLLRTKEDALPYLPLGAGSNLLIKEHYEGIVLKMEMAGISIVQENEHAVWLRIGAGLPWQVLVDYCLEQGYYGLENLTQIPGCVGAAPTQNIGAYGVELSSFFEELEALSTKTRTIKKFNHKACAFGYRYSLFKEPRHKHWVITQVTLRLPKVFRPECGYGALQDALNKQGITAPTARQIEQTVRGIRSSKLPNPDELGNAGSFFKNPIMPKRQYLALREKHPHLNLTAIHEQSGRVKISASALIEQAGWKGKRVGKVGVYDRHALVLVNYGKATGKAIWQMAQAIIRDVKEKFGVQLAPEVTVL